MLKKKAPDLPALADLWAHLGLNQGPPDYEGGHQ